MAFDVVRIPRKRSALPARRGCTCVHISKQAGVATHSIASAFVLVAALAWHDLQVRVSHVELLHTLVPVVAHPSLTFWRARKGVVFVHTCTCTGTNKSESAAEFSDSSAGKCKVQGAPFFAGS